MKKFLMFLACVVFAGITASAQQVFEITGIEQVSTTVGRIHAGAKTLNVNVYLYQQVKNNPGGYYYAEAYGTMADGTLGWGRTIVEKNKVSYAVLEVDSVGLNGDMVLVFLKGNKMYQSRNTELLKIQPGQHVEYWYIDGITHPIRNFRTVDRKTPLTTTVPVQNTQNKDFAQVTPPTPQAKGQNMTPPAPPANGNGQNMTPPAPPANRNGNGQNMTPPAPPTNGNGNGQNMTPPAPPTNGNGQNVTPPAPPVQNNTTTNRPPLIKK